MCFAKSWLLVAVIFASFLCFYLILNGKAWRISPVIPIRGDPRGYLGTGGGGWVSTLDYFPIEGSLGLASGRGNAGSIVTPSPSNCPRSLRPWGCLNLIPQVWDFHSSILSIDIASAGLLVRGIQVGNILCHLLEDFTLSHFFLLFFL